MDWIQIYFLVVLVIGFTVNAVKHGETRDMDEYHLGYWSIHMVLAAPWIGRIFGWW